MKSFTSILVDLDATASAHPALERAVRLARFTGAAIRIVDVVSAPGDARSSLDSHLEDELMKRRREQLARISNGVRDLIVDTDVLTGPPAEALIRDVIRFRHDLVVRSHARDLVARSSTPVASVDLQLLRHCPCPVWAVGPGTAPQDPKIVGAIDAAVADPLRQRLNTKIVEAAVILSGLLDGSLTLLNAWHPAFETQVRSHSNPEEFAAYLDSARRTAKANLARTGASFGALLSGASFELRRGDVEEVVPQFAVAQGIDVVVIGTTGRTGIARRLPGSTAERLLRKLPCSIVTVKPDDFVSTVRCW